MTAFDADLRSLAAQTTLSRRTVIATSLATGFALAVQPVAAQTTIGGDIGNGADQAYLGYVFKNVGGFADVLAIAGSDETYGIRVRKDLGNNFEAGIQYLKGGVGGDSEYGIQLGYNVSKQVSVDLGYIRIKDAVGSADATQWSLGLRYNF